MAPDFPRGERHPFCAVALSGLACLVYKRYFVFEVLDADCVFVNTQAQLSQLYYAFAIAVTLGRTIVLPEVSALPMMSSCTGCSAAHPIPMVATHSFSTSARCPSQLRCYCQNALTDPVGTCAAVGQTKSRPFSCPLDQVTDVGTGLRNMHAAFHALCWPLRHAVS